MIEFESNGGAAQGYLATPESGAGPGVVVLQEWWGLVPHIKDVCERLAREGFTALAPDLYHGEQTRSPDEAGKLMMALNIGQAERDMRGAIQFLSAHESVQGASVGALGFCMGGALALYAASKNPEVGACVVFYGIHPKVKPDFERLRAPVIGFFGEDDEMVTPAKARELEATLREHGQSVETHIYSGAGHAFFNDTRPEAFRPEAAADAWQRTIAFLRRYLS
jgi:carboxymethylenebutenolidase